jgi:hypothetical protein
MDKTTTGTRGRLAAIAREAMKSCGLLPDFSAEALNELKSLAQAGAAATHITVS